MAWRPRGGIRRTRRIGVPDPVSEYAEYLVIARGGITKVYLSQRGRLQDPGTVAVICAPPLGAKQTVGRWLSRIRRTVMAWLRGVDVEAEMAPLPATAATSPLAGAASGVPEPSQRAPGRDTGALRSRSRGSHEPAQPGDGGRARDVA
jgi:hypothetical protein